MLYLATTAHISYKLAPLFAVIQWCLKLFLRNIACIISFKSLIIIFQDIVERRHLAALLPLFHMKLVSLEHFYF